MWKRHGYKFRPALLDEGFYLLGFVVGKVRKPQTQHKLTILCGHGASYGITFRVSPLGVAKACFKTSQRLTACGFEVSNHPTNEKPAATYSIKGQTNPSLGTGQGQNTFLKNLSPSAAKSMIYGPCLQNTHFFQGNQSQKPKNDLSRVSIFLLASSISGQSRLSSSASCSTPRPCSCEVSQAAKERRSSWERWLGWRCGLGFTMVYWLS